MKATWIEGGSGSGPAVCRMIETGPAPRWDRSDARATQSALGSPRQRDGADYLAARRNSAKGVRSRSQTTAMPLVCASSRFFNLNTPAITPIGIA